MLEEYSERDQRRLRNFFKERRKENLIMHFFRRVAATYIIFSKRPAKAPYENKLRIHKVVPPGNKVRQEKWEEELKVSSSYKTNKAIQNVSKEEYQLQ